MSTAVMDGMPLGSSPILYLPLWIEEKVSSGDSLPTSCNVVAEIKHAVTAEISVVVLIQRNIYSSTRGESYVC